jgi:ABC-type glycerol-3-phosphate transport system permease component
MRGPAWSFSRTGAAAVISVPFLYPFFFLVTTALKPESQYVHDKLGVPHHLSSEHLRYAWVNAHLGHAMLNSLIACGIGVIVLILISATGAYWFLRHPTRRSKALMVTIASAWIFPLVIWILPYFVKLSWQGLTDNLVVLGVVYGATNAPFGLYLMYTFYREGIPPEVAEAAAVDGASTFQQFLRIILPLSMPAIGVLAALGFVWTWGDLLLAVVVIQSPDHWTLTQAASTLIQRFNLSAQNQAAAALISILPLLVIFLAAQRAIVKGFTAGIGK